MKYGAVICSFFRIALAKYIPCLGTLLCVRPRDLRSTSSSFISTRRSTLTSQSSDISSQYKRPSTRKSRLSSASDSESVSSSTFHQKAGRTFTPDLMKYGFSFAGFDRHWGRLDQLELPTSQPTGFLWHQQGHSRAARHQTLLQLQVQVEKSWLRHIWKGKLLVRTALFHPASKIFRFDTAKTVFLATLWSQ